MKEKVISTLANHDGLRAHEREAFAAYLLDVLTKAEASAVQIAELQNKPRKSAGSSGTTQAVKVCAACVQHAAHWPCFGFRGARTCRHGAEGHGPQSLRGIETRIALVRQGIRCGPIGSRFSYPMTTQQPLRQKGR